jgi:ABC-type multidrug transport system fused ATPase/permease subunit
VGTAPAAAPAGAGRLVKEESRARGAAGLPLFFSYMAEMGGPLLAAVFSSLLLSTAARTAVDWVLAMWSTDALGRPLGWYVGAYLGVSAAAIALTLFNSAAWAGGGLRAARALHDAMLATVLRCPVQYFDVTPTGRLLNVFSNDVGALDKELPTQLASAAGLALRIAATIVVQAIILPWTLLGSVPLVAVYLFVSAVYRANGRELKRLDLSSKSLAAACLSESVGAQSTIAAWGAGARFSAALQAALDTNLRACVCRSTRAKE